MSKPEVLHGGGRSGYAADIMPEIATTGMKGAVLPPATLSGRQRGQQAPAVKRYGQAKYETVDAVEAMQRMNKRSKGQMPPIMGGLDDPNGGRATLLKNAEQAAQSVQNSVAQMITRTSQDIPEDEWGETASGDGEMDGFEPLPLDQPPHRRTMTVPTSVQTPRLVAPLEAQPDQRTQYLAQRRRLTMELSDSTVSLSVVDMIHSRYGITILLPQTQDGATFIPKPGSELTLREGDKSYKCYFPGTYFDLPVLGLIGLSFVKQDEGA